MALKTGWSSALLAAMGLTVDVDLRHAAPGALLVANHVSWVDVFVINAALPCAFVAKEEVRRWPFFGWLAAKNDTVFMRRGSRGHARTINGEVADMLARGKHVAVFPEGTTTDGRSVRHFHAALLQPALEAACPVVPTAISYWERDGQRSVAPRYDGDITFGQCLMAILGSQRLMAKLTTLPPLGLNGEDRRQVAVEARAVIASSAGLLLSEHSPDVRAGPETRQPHERHASANEDTAPAESR